LLSDFTEVWLLPYVNYQNKQRCERGRGAAASEGLDRQGSSRNHYQMLGVQSHVFKVKWGMKKSNFREENEMK
jgi:hypothetical protein